MQTLEQDFDNEIFLSPIFIFIFLLHIFYSENDAIHSINLMSL